MSSISTLGAECRNPLSEGWILVHERALSIPSSEQTFEAMTPLRSLTLSDNWEWKQKPKDELEVETLASKVGWRRTSVPTEIFKDLLEAGDIPDPHVDRNENDVQWVGEVDWLYRTRFTLDYKPNEREKAVLVFEGLDTFANVYLNGSLILKSEVTFLWF
jgi:beta-mannosidase